MEPQNTDTSPVQAQLAFGSSAEIRRSTPSRQKFSSLSFSRRTTVCLTGFAVSVAVAAFLCALWTRPFSATTRLLIHDNAFADANEAAEFAAFVTSVPSLDRLARKLMWPTSGRELAQNCWLTFD